MLGKIYKVAGLLEWLLNDGIDGSIACASYEFGILPEGVLREGLLARCVVASRMTFGKPNER